MRTATITNAAATDDRQAGRKEEATYSYRNSSWECLSSKTWRQLIIRTDAINEITNANPYDAYEQSTTCIS